MHSLTFKVISEVIPHAVETGFSWIKTWINEPIPKSELEIKLRPFPSKTSRKTHNHTKITAKQHDDILMAKDDLDFTNGMRLSGTRKITQDQLVAELNKTLGLNKSKAFYIRIWNGHKERPLDLPENKR
jgi:seryl-tRNA synthetase